MKISRAFVQRKRISDSCNCTCFPGLLPRTAGHAKVYQHAVIAGGERSGKVPGNEGSLPNSRSAAAACMGETRAPTNGRETIRETQMVIERALHRLWYPTTPCNRGSSPSSRRSMTESMSTSGVCSAIASWDY